jgi:MFS family permease
VAAGLARGPGHGPGDRVRRGDARWRADKAWPAGPRRRPRRPAFLAASSTATTGLSPEAGLGASGVDAFLAIGVAGLAGCLIGGWAADHAGRAGTAAAALAVSGACCLLSPLSFTASRPWLLAFAAVWGAAVIADSGVYSTLLSELADRRCSPPPSAGATPCWPSRPGR